MGLYMKHIVFCSICFTILNKLWPDDTKLVHNKKAIEASHCDRRDSLDYLIKNSPVKYNKFIEERDHYINYLFSNY